MQRLNILSSFWLKIIAMVTMTLDHFGLIMSEYYLSNSDTLVIALRSIGRLAMPLYCFMIAEGVFHTKSFLKYFIRLSVMAVFISASIYVIEETNVLGKSMVSGAGNIFLDLTLGAVGVFCIKHKDYRIKLLAILPLLFGVTSYIVRSYEISEGAVIHWLPYFLRTQYGWYSITLIYGFYLSRIGADLFLHYQSERSGASYESLKGTNLELDAIKIINLFLFLGITAGFIICINLTKFEITDQQIFCVFAGVLLLLYNNKRGYNKKWFEYGCYLYYPVHIGILGLIFYLLNM